MKRPATLIEPKEVVFLSGINQDFPPCSIVEIKQIELSEKRNCLKDLYDALLADKQDYSGTASWSAGSYTAEQVVEYKGVYYQATVNTSNAPSHPDWEYADKFNEAEYNELWTGFLGPYLALLALRQVIPMSATKVSSQGIVKQKGDDFDAADEREVKLLISAIDAKISLYQKNLLEELEGKEDNDLFAGYFESGSCGCSCGGTGYLDLPKYEADGHICYIKTPCGCTCDACRGRTKRNLNVYAVG